MKMVNQVETWLIPLQDQDDLNEQRLQLWLSQDAPELGKIKTVRQFRGGLSNPTYLIEGDGVAYVLRKQPTGSLLPSAHALDREYRVLACLRDTDVPVPRVVAYCDDITVLGTEFYLMEMIPGRLFPNPSLRECSSEQRKLVYNEFATVLGSIHRVDWREILDGFGRPQNYLRRQVKRWSTQFESAGIHSDDMKHLMAWVTAHVPYEDESGNECTLVHGDYRLANVLFHRDSPRIAGVLDWELATIGHPLADLAYSCLPWRLTAEMNGLVDNQDSSLPSEREYISAYCKQAGRSEVPDFEFYIAFSLFRWACILAGVYRRTFDGGVSNTQRDDTYRRFEKIVELGRRTIQSA